MRCTLSFSAWPCLQVIFAFMTAAVIYIYKPRCMFITIYIYVCVCVCVMCYMCLEVMPPCCVYVSIVYTSIYADITMVTALTYIWMGFPLTAYNARVCVCVCVNVCVWLCVGRHFVKWTSSLCIYAFSPNIFVHVNDGCDECYLYIYIYI